MMSDHDEAPGYSNDNPGFEGEYEFDLTVEMLGRRSTRRAKAVYAHTPYWEYFDLKKKALCVVDIASTSLHIEILAIPREFREDDTIADGEPYWAMLNDLTLDYVLPELFWEAIYDAIDDRCKSEDAERRKKLKGRRRHRAAIEKRCTSRRRALREGDREQSRCLSSRAAFRKEDRA